MVKNSNIISILKEYGLWGTIKLMLEVVLAKLFVGKQIRIMKCPYQLIGKKYIKFGRNFSSGRNLRVEALRNSGRNPPNLLIGDDVKIGHYVHIGCANYVFIGSNVLIGSHVLIIDHNHGSYSTKEIKHDSPLIPPDQRQLSSSTVEIGDNAWIGEFVSVLPDTKIGEGTIIGSMSVVKGNIPPFSMAIGSPAKIIKKFNFNTGRWEKT